MPDSLNKQTLINLLIDSPLREPIKINLIDIVNNTVDADLPKTYSTIVKELEIFQKATERRMKLAEETIAKLGGTSPENESVPTAPAAPTPEPAPAPLPAAPAPTELSAPALDLPPLPTVPAAPAAAEPAVAPAPAVPAAPLPPLEPPKAADADEAALAEIQKELDSLKTSVSTDAGTAPAAPQQ